MSARLYFQLVSSHALIPDLEGVEVADVGQAHASALRTVQELRQEDTASARGWSGWTLHATDFVGRTVFSITLDRAVQ